MRGFRELGVDELSDFNASILLTDWTPAGQGCCSVEAVGIDDDVAAEGIGAPRCRSNFANLPNAVAEIGDGVFDLLKPSRPLRFPFGGETAPHLAAKRQYVLHLVLLLEIGLSSL